MLFDFDVGVKWVEGIQDVMCNVGLIGFIVYYVGEKEENWDFSIFVRVEVYSVYCFFLVLLVMLVKGYFIGVVVFEFDCECNGMLINVFVIFKLLL